MAHARRVLHRDHEHTLAAVSDESSCDRSLSDRKAAPRRHSSHRRVRHRPAAPRAGLRTARNTTFRVSSTDKRRRRSVGRDCNRRSVPSFACTVPLVTVAMVDSRAAITSELDWLVALRADTALSVPEPVPDVVRSADDDGGGRRRRRIANVLVAAVDERSQPQPFPHDRFTCLDSAAVLAQLHKPWRSMANRPKASLASDGTTRRSSANAMVYGNVDAADAWKLLPGEPPSRLFERVRRGSG